MTSIAIHGFGHIGRATLKAALARHLFLPVVISDVQDLATLAALFAYDSNHGRWPAPVAAHAGKLRIREEEIVYLNAGRELPDWGALGVRVVVDCTGRATTRAEAERHLARGAQHVLVSATSKSRADADALLLVGLNWESFDPRRHRIVSMGSCTTNALAPVVHVLRDLCGIQHGRFTAVHAYTNTQTLTDQPLSQRRAAWAATDNIIPAASGAAEALRYLWPDLPLTGRAYRVPVRVGNVVELTIISARSVTRLALAEAFQRAADTGPLQDVLGVLPEEYTSARLINEPRSSVIDLPAIQVAEERLVSVAAWYDHQTGYGNRLAELATQVAQRSADALGSGS